MIFLDINECVSSPCLNNGTCTNTIGSYTCACSTVFSGKHCENSKEKFLNICNFLVINLLFKYSLECKKWLFYGLDKTNKFNVLRNFILLNEILLCKLNLIYSFEIQECPPSGILIVYIYMLINKSTLI